MKALIYAQSSRRANNGYFEMSLDQIRPDRVVNYDGCYEMGRLRVYDDL